MELIKAKIKLGYKNQDLNYYIVHTLYDEDGDGDPSNDIHTYINPPWRDGSEEIDYAFKVNRTHILTVTGRGRKGSKLKLTIDEAKVNETIKTGKDGQFFRRIIFSIY